MDKSSGAISAAMLIAPCVATAVGYLKSCLPCPQEVTEFFRTLHAKKQKDGLLTWQILRATLVHSVVPQRISATKEVVTGEWLPLSVWKQRGWTDEILLRQEHHARTTVKRFTRYR